MGVNLQNTMSKLRTPRQANYAKNALYSVKIYTAGKHFTRPPVATVATNFNPAGEIMFSIMAFFPSLLCCGISFTQFKKCARVGEKQPNKLSGFGRCTTLLKLFSVFSPNCMEGQSLLL